MKIKQAALIVMILFSLIQANLVFSQEENPLTLEESIRIALAQNLGIHAAKEGVKAAEAQKNEAWSAFFPKLSTTYSFTRLNEDPSFQFPGIPDLIPPREMIMGTEDNYTWAFEVKQPIFTGWAITENYTAGKLGQDVAKFEESAKMLDTIEQVKAAYFNILKAKRLREVAIQSMEQLTAHRNVAQGFYDVRMIPQNELLRADVEVANGRKFLLKAENGVEMTKSAFNILLRRDINTPAVLADVPVMHSFNLNIDDCIRMAHESRPELKAYSLKVKQGESMVQAAKSEYYPTVSAVGHFERFGDSPSLSGSDYKDDQSWYVSAVASWNFWDWGKTKNRVSQGMARVNQMNDGLFAMKDQITLEVKNAWLNLHEAEKQVNVAEIAVKQAQENLRVTQERYNEHLTTSTEVLDSQTLLTRAKTDHENAIGDYHMGFARLERAIGADIETSELK